MKKFLFTFLSLGLPFAVSAQSNTVADIIVESENHTLLEAAVVEAGLVGALSDLTGTFTVFAPTDNAFIALASLMNIEVEDLLELPNLAEIILYHVLTEVYLEEVLLPYSSNSMLGTLVPTEPIYLQSDGTTITVNGLSSVIESDLIANNGVVHVVDAVIFTPGTSPNDVSVLDVIVDSDNHNILEAAVIAAELDDDLSSSGSFTIFAPTDEAFDALGSVVTDLLSAPTGELADILLHHVVAGKVLSNDLSAGAVETLNGSNLDVSFDGGNLFINDAQVVVADIRTRNGVVHVIDAVLLQTPTSTSDSRDLGIKIYPNPATDFIQLDGNLDQVESIQIANTQGQIVKQINRLNGNNINIGALQTGMYIISIYQKDKIGTLRIVID